MARRRGWSGLSQSYRDRLRAAGISRADWEAGADLRSARGQTPGPPRGAAPREATERAVMGEGRTEDFAVIERWAAGSSKPDWIPDDMSERTAAALSQLPPPSQWSNVSFRPVADGEPWTMVVERTAGYTVEIQIPGGGAPFTRGAREVLDWLAHEEGIDFDVEGS